jgi:menaquinone-9 beta-reductase
MTYDLAIVGAGPAGSSAALAALHADPRLRVLLLDRADFPRDKSCGDGIPPHVFRALARIGVTGVEDGWVPLRRLELARGDLAVARDMASDVHVIPRQVLDARLVERAVDCGAELVRHRVRALSADADGVTIDDTYRARVVLGADGAHSVVRQHLGLPEGRRAIAIRGYAPTPDARRAVQVIRYGDRPQPAYAWSFDRGDGLANVGYGELLDPDRPASRSDLLAQLEALLPGSADGGTGWKGHHLPLSGFRWHQPDGRLLLAGDAAGLINPMTGEGIYYAVATGIVAGQVAASRAEDPGASHRAGVRRELGTHLKHTYVAARLSEHPAFVDGGIRLANRDRAVFDQLVELGLGDGRISPRLVGGLAAGVAGKGWRRLTGYRRA